MNITIITSSFPFPLNSGGAQGQFNLLDKLRHRHNIVLICPENGKNKQNACKELQKMWPEVELCLYPYTKQLMHLPFLWDKLVRAIKLKFCSNDERFQVERALKPYGYNLSQGFLTYANRIIREHKTDLIQVDFYPYLRIVRHLPKDVKKVFIQHEIRYIRNRRLLENLHLNDSEQLLFNQIRQEEIDNLNIYNQVITMSQTDANILKNDGVSAPIAVSPSAVNSPILPFVGWNGKLCFIGGYSHIPNHEGMDWFLEKVLPLVNTDNIQTIDVVGGGWPQEYKNMHPKVHFLGFVEDLASVVHQSVLIVPILTGSGMRMKILDAAAMSIPFITTTVGVEGLLFQSEESCLIADTPEDFATAINQLVGNKEQMKQLAIRAQSIYKEHYSVEALSEIRNSIYQNIILS